MFLELEKKHMKKWWIKSVYKKSLLIILIWILAFLILKKESLLLIINKALPSREAGLLSGMVWGEKSAIKGEFYNSLIRTGLIHIVVVSGTNLMIVGRGLIENLAKLIGRKMAIMGGGGIILIYVNLVGWQLPIIRAFLFLEIFYISQMLGRKFNVFRALVLVIGIMFLADWQIYKEVSFWLSIVSFVAVLLNQNKNILKTTFWINIFILPILSISFGEISLISPLVNIMVLFLVEIVSVLGFWGGIIGLICQKISMLVLLVNYPLLRYLIEVVELGGSWKWAMINFHFNWWMLIGWYLILGAYWYEKKKI